MNSDGSDQTLLTPFASNYDTTDQLDAHFSPDGSQIVYYSEQPYGNTNLFTVTPDGSSRTELTFIDDPYSSAPRAVTPRWAVAPAPADTTPPTTVDDAPGGWVNHAVVVHLTATDDSSGVASTFFSVDGGPQQTGTNVDVPAPADHSNDGTQAIRYFSVDNAGNVEAAHTILVRIDTTPPTVTVAFDATPNAAGWYRTPLHATFTCNDDLSGVASCPGPLTVGEGANQVISGTATDAAGNTGVTAPVAVNVDLTAPVVAFSGNAGTYTVADAVAITCNASDNLSGVASSTCTSVNAPAWTFGLGSKTLTASATDVAGNQGSGSATFTITVSISSLDQLIGQFFGGDAGGASGLIAKADAITAAPNATAKQGKLNAFEKQVTAKLGKPLTKAEADALDQFASAL